MYTIMKYDRSATSSFLPIAYTIARFSTNTIAGINSPADTAIGTSKKSASVIYRSGITYILLKIGSPCSISLPVIAEYSYMLPLASDVDTISQVSSFTYDGAR